MQAVPSRFPTARIPSLFISRPRGRSGTRIRTTHAVTTAATLVLLTTAAACGGGSADKVSGPNSSCGGTGDTFTASVAGAPFTSMTGHARFSVNTAEFTVVGLQDTNTGNSIFFNYRGNDLPKDSTYTMSDEFASLQWDALVSGGNSSWKTSQGSGTLTFTCVDLTPIPNRNGYQGRLVGTYKFDATDLYGNTATVTGTFNAITG